MFQLPTRQKMENDMAQLAGAVTHYPPPETGAMIYLILEPPKTGGEPDELYEIPAHANYWHYRVIRAYVTAVYYSDGHIDVAGHTVDGVALSSAMESGIRQFTISVAQVMDKLGQAQKMTAKIQSATGRDAITDILFEFVMHEPPNHISKSIIDYCLDHVGPDKVDTLRDILGLLAEKTQRDAEQVGKKLAEVQAELDEFEE